MPLRRLAILFATFAVATAQPPSQAIVANLDSANWTREKGAPADSEGAVLRTDPATGGMDLSVRFPAGHIVAAHWHEANERVFVAEGSSPCAKTPVTE